MITASVMKELKQFSEMFRREVLRLPTSQPFLRLCIMGNSFNPLTINVSHHIETSQLTGFYMMENNGC